MSTLILCTNCNTVRETLKINLSLRTLLNKREKSEHSFLSPDFSENASKSSSFNMMSSIGGGIQFSVGYVPSIQMPQKCAWRSDRICLRLFYTSRDEQVTYFLEIVWNKLYLLIHVCWNIPTSLERS